MYGVSVHVNLWAGIEAMSAQTYLKSPTIPFIAIKCRDIYESRKNNYLH